MSVVTLAEKPVEPCLDFEPEAMARIMAIAPSAGGKGDFHDVWSGRNEHDLERTPANLRAKLIDTTLAYLMAADTEGEEVTGAVGEARLLARLYYTLRDAIDLLDVGPDGTGMVPTLHKRLRFAAERQRPGNYDERSILRLRSLAAGVVELAALARDEMEAMCEHEPEAVKAVIAGRIKAAKAAQTAWRTFVGGALPAIFEWWTSNKYGASNNDTDRPGVRFAEAVLNVVKVHEVPSRSAISKQRTEFNRRA
jgi:hypothetical protein